MKRLLQGLIVVLVTISLDSCRYSQKAEAKEKISVFVQDKLFSCKNSFFTQKAVDNRLGQTIYLTEFKEVSMEMESRDLSGAEKLNGSEFDGGLRLKSMASRVAISGLVETGNGFVMKDPCWSSWSDGGGEYFSITRSHGNWNIALTEGEEFLPINCKKVQEIPMCQ